MTKKRYKSTAKKKIALMTAEDYRRARVEMKLSQTELAGLLNIHQMTISKRECGLVKIGLEQAMALKYLRLAAPYYLPEDL